MPRSNKTYNPRVARPVIIDRFRGRTNAGGGPEVPGAFVEDGFNFWSDRIGRQSTRDGQSRSDVCGVSRFSSAVHSASRGLGYLAMGEGGSVWLCKSHLSRSQVDISELGTDPYKPEFDFDFDAIRQSDPPYIPRFDPPPPPPAIEFQDTDSDIVPTNNPGKEPGSYVDLGGGPYEDTGDGGPDRHPAGTPGGTPIGNPGTPTGIIGGNPTSGDPIITPDDTPGGGGSGGGSTGGSGWNFGGGSYGIPAGGISSSPIRNLISRGGYASEDGSPPPPPGGGAFEKVCHVVKYPIPMIPNRVPIRKLIKRSGDLTNAQKCYLSPSVPDESAAEAFDTTFEELVTQKPPVVVEYDQLELAPPIREDVGPIFVGTGLLGCALGSSYYYRMAVREYTEYIVGYCYTITPLESPGTDWIEAEYTKADGSTQTFSSGNLGSNTITFCDESAGTSADDIIENGLPVGKDEAGSGSNVKLYGVYNECVTRAVN